MEKLQEDVKRMVNNVHVPTDKLNQTVLESLKIGRSTKRQSFVKKQTLFASIASIFILAIGALLLPSFLESSTTANVPHNILYNNGTEGLKMMVKEGKVNNLSLESEDQNIKVVLEEGYLDNHQLALSYYIEFKDQLSKNNETTDIELELLVNKHSDGISYFSGMNTKDLEQRGDILRFFNTKEFPPSSELEIHIHKINGIKGNWSFAFTLPKESEFIEKTSPIVKTDANENVFAVNNVQLTPSVLLLETKTDLKLKEPLPQNSYLELLLIAIGPNGTMYPEKPLRSSSKKGAYDQIVFDRAIFEDIQLHRSINAYQYKIVPYITTYKGREVPSSNGKAYIWDSVTEPFKIGAILNLEAKIKVADIKVQSDKTIVHYEMDPLQPVFPNIRNHKTDQMYEAISFKQFSDHIEVTYPNVSNREELEFYIVDSAYKVFSDLEITIDLNE